MPYSVLICEDCDLLIHEQGPHGPEDGYCEGIGQRTDLYVERECYGKAAPIVDQFAYADSAALELRKLARGET